MNFRKLFALASSPTPGLYFSDPYIGVSLYASQNEVRAEIPDLSEEGNGTSELLGQFSSGEEIIQLVAKFLQREDLELPLAVYCHFKKHSRDDIPLWSSMPYFYWLEPGEGSQHLIRELNEYLLKTSELYSELARAVSQNPDELGQSFEDSIDFSAIYQRHR